MQSSFTSPLQPTHQRSGRKQCTNLGFAGEHHCLAIESSRPPEEEMHMWHNISVCNQGDSETKIIGT